MQCNLRQSLMRRREPLYVPGNSRLFSSQQTTKVVGSNNSAGSATLIHRWALLIEIFAIRFTERRSASFNPTLQPPLQQQSGDCE